MDLNFGDTLSAESKLLKVSFTISVVSIDSGESIRVYLGAANGG